MINVTDKTKCSGCRACANICPKNCIQTVPDNEGFLYPQVNEELCVNCGLCENVCPIINEVSKNTAVSGFAAINKDQETRMNSSSGGVFTAFAEYIIKNSGVVFGAAFSEDFKSVEHIAVTNLKDLYKLKGSKYLQSEIGDTYKQARQYL